MSLIFQPPSLYPLKMTTEHRTGDASLDDAVCQRSEHKHVKSAWLYAPF
jgi:hypothetical protein